MQDLNNIFKTHGLKNTHQRTLIYKFLLENRIHPTVEQIYEALKPEMSSLSKTTVYNVLKTLQEYKLVRTVPIDDTEVRYDGYTHTHGHFKCTNCGSIHDFNIEINPTIKGLDGFKIEKQDYFINGLCDKCNKRNNN